jgi:predicted nucleotidyltransferase
LRLLFEFYLKAGVVSVDDSIFRAIQERLGQMEVEHGITIIHAVESGSRVWGLHSPNSDYDVRFIYVRPLSWYLSVRDRRDVIETPVDGLLDISGWDLQKALNLMARSNPPLMEWLQSSVVYKTTPTVDRIRALSKPYFNARATMYHYFHMAEGNYRNYLQGDTVRLKKYLYVIRPILCCRHIERSQKMPPIVMQDMIDQESNIPFLEIGNLLAAKAKGEELSVGPRIATLNDFIEKELQRFARIARTMPTPKNAMDDLDEFFFNTVRGSSASRQTFEA